MEAIQGCQLYGTESVSHVVKKNVLLKPLSPRLRKELLGAFFRYRRGHRTIGYVYCLERETLNEHIFQNILISLITFIT